MPWNFHSGSRLRKQPLSRILWSYCPADERAWQTAQWLLKSLLAHELCCVSILILTSHLTQTDINEWDSAIPPRYKWSALVKNTIRHCSALIIFHKHLEAIVTSEIAQATYCQKRIFCLSCPWVLASVSSAEKWASVTWEGIPFGLITNVMTNVNDHKKWKGNGFMGFPFFIKRTGWWIPSFKCLHFCISDEKNYRSIKERGREKKEGMFSF